ncbi:MAG: hemerythrin family protein [Rhodospirillales bacterium]|jgi:hemerythrin|nr:hemerythrin family protein [Rhodospirillales bacterium]
MNGFNLEWRDEYLLGIDELDFEHKDLFRRLNELHEELVQDNDKERVSGSLGGIYARLDAHFALEENYMREKKYAGYEQHKKQHDNFLDELREVSDKLLSSGIDIEERNVLESKLQGWVLNHFTTTDRDLPLDDEDD